MSFTFDLPSRTITCDECGHVSVQRERIYYIPAGKTIRIGCSNCGHMTEPEGLADERPIKIVLFPADNLYIANIEPWLDGGD